MLQFFIGRLLETEDLATLWVQTAHHMFDHPVLAGSIHTLQHHEQRMLVAGPEQLLRIRHSLEIPFDDSLSLPLQTVTSQLAHLPATVPGGIPVVQAYYAARLYTKHFQFAVGHDSLNIDELPDSCSPWRQNWSFRASRRNSRNSPS